jgi:hypothetical protein
MANWAYDMGKQADPSMGVRVPFKGWQLGFPTLTALTSRRLPAALRPRQAAAPGQPRAAGARQGAARGACTRGWASVLPGRAREPPAARAPEAGRACCRGAPGSRRAARTRGRASPFREDGEAVSASAHGCRHRQTVSLSPTMTPARVAVERGGAPADVPPCCRSGSRASTVRPFRMGRRRESG